MCPVNFCVSCLHYNHHLCFTQTPVQKHTVSSLATSGSTEWDLPPWSSRTTCQVILVLILAGESSSLNRVPVQEETQDLFLSASQPAILQRAQGAHPLQRRGRTRLRETHIHDKRQWHTERDRQESQREADTERGAGAYTVCSARREDSETFTKQAVFLRDSLRKKSFPQADPANSGILPWPRWWRNRKGGWKAKGQAGRREGGKQRWGKVGEWREGRRLWGAVSPLDAQSVPIWPRKPRGHLHVLFPLW